jgi:hypothetical protein
VDGQATCISSIDMRTTKQTDGKHSKKGGQNHGHNSKHAQNQACVGRDMSIVTKDEDEKHEEDNDDEDKL